MLPSCSAYRLPRGITLGMGRLNIDLAQQGACLAGSAIRVCALKAHCARTAFSAHSIVGS